MMAEKEMREIKERHESYQNPITRRCEWCNRPWPCDAILLIDVIDRMRLEGRE